MRKNTARHWLHATLDLLPVILIPVFMIYSHRHDLSTDITIQQDVYKDFYQGVKNGKPTQDLNYINILDNRSHYFENGLFFITFDENNLLSIDYDIQLNVNNGLNKIYYYYDFRNEDNESSPFFNNELDIYIYSDIDEEIPLTEDYFNELNLFSGILEYSNLYGASYFNKFNLFSESNEYEINIGLNNIQFFNLTTIFGSGNEPTKEVFESYLIQDYYDYGSNQVKVGTIDVQAKNNDIMSVFMDSFNNSVNKYFNMGNVFNMTSVYNWFNTNIFGGTAPVVIYSVWNIVLYEFVMDLMFLLYGLFMFFIDMCKRLMEKPLDSIK